MSEMIERVAKALAKCHGDNWDDLPANKSHWTAQRGQFGGRFRDVNERYRCDYLDEAEAAIEAMEDPTEAMIEAGNCRTSVSASMNTVATWQAMIGAARGYSLEQARKEG